MNGKRPKCQNPYRHEQKLKIKLQLKFKDTHANKPYVLNTAGQTGGRRGWKFVDVREKGKGKQLFCK